MNTFNQPIKQDQIEEGAEGTSAQTSESSGSDYESMVNKLQQENEAMQRKMDELLGETKRAKEMKRQAEEQARREAEEKARKAGDYEQLHKSSEQERERLQNELKELHNRIAKEKESATALRIAGEIADGPNAEILSEFIKGRLKYTEDGIKILDNNGQLTVSTIENLKAEFQSNGKFASLLKGSQATGGSAPGGATSGPAEKMITRAEFETLSVKDKAKYMKEVRRFSG